MELKFECQKCGANIRAGDMKPGEAIKCPKCDTDNLVPQPAPRTLVTTIMAYVISGMWFLSLSFMVWWALMWIFWPIDPTGARIDHLMNLDIPMTVTLDQPVPASREIPGSEMKTVSILGYESVVVDTVLPISWLYSASFLLYGCGILWVLYHLRCFFTRARNGRPFSRDNPRRLRFIAFGIFVYIAIDEFLIYMLSKMYVEHMAISGATLAVPSIGFAPELIFLALVILVIAQIFDWGCKLQQDQDLTV